MASMPASYSIGPYFESFIKDQVGSGRFASASEVVREGLRLVEEREAQQQAKLEWLRREIQKGIDSGPGIPAEQVYDGLYRLIDEIEEEQAGL